MGICNYEGSLPFASVLAIVLFGVLAYACYKAYVARNVSTEFAESEYIALVLVAIVLVTFMGVPIMIIAKDEPRARFVVSAGISFIVCL
jgi:gamma-aminobutyric acid type B receptor